MTQHPEDPHLLEQYREASGGRGIYRFFTGEPSQGRSRRIRGAIPVNMLY
jgi:hypothetical protein